MNKQDIIDFFDRLAPTWDESALHDDRIINAILDAGGISSGVRVLDAACGTGVLFPEYLKRGVASVDAADISSGMIKLAAAKAEGTVIKTVRADVTEYLPEAPFDRIMLYNAFPHFPDPEALFEHLSGLLVRGGRLTVAHGASREKIDAHHKGAAKNVSVGLMPAEDLAALMSRRLAVDTVISDDEKYIVSGVKI